MKLMRILKKAITDTPHISIDMEQTQHSKTFNKNPIGNASVGKCSTIFVTNHIAILSQKPGGQPDPSCPP
jgi:hypothetical protein